jgi:hypothetical protein
MSVLLNSSLEAAIGLTRYDEIPGEFTFRGSECFRGVETIHFTITRNEGFRKRVEGRARAVSLPTTRTQELLMLGSGDYRTGSTAFPSAGKGVGV